MDLRKQAHVATHKFGRVTVISTVLTAKLYQVFKSNRLQNSVEATGKLKMFSRLKLQWLHQICNSFLMWKRNKGDLCFP